jgi:hypothetical protein
MVSENIVNLVVYHGTDYNIAKIIEKTNFKYKRSKKHWLGNGIYFYKDITLANWWTTKPSNSFGTDISKAAILKCVLMIREDRVLDLRKLDDYLWFSEQYTKEFLPMIYSGEIKIQKDKDTGKFNSKRLRCAFCDFIRHQYKIDAIIGTFNLPKQPYLPKEYGDGFKDFALEYIETQICIFNKKVIKEKKIL